MCSKSQPLSAFAKDAGKGDGLSPRCKSCEREHHARTNPLRKHYRQLSMALHRTDYYSLDGKAREEIRRHVRRLHESGVAVSRVALAEEEKTADGFVYVLVNPAWPGMVKIGSAVDVASRLDQFQTGSPFRDYEMVYSVYTLDRLKAERACHAKIASSRLQGEWFSCSVEFAKVIINQVRDLFEEADVQQAFAKVEA